MTGFDSLRLSPSSLACCIHVAGASNFNSQTANIKPQTSNIKPQPEQHGLGFYS
jgi:hypothetical protein